MIQTDSCHLLSHSAVARTEPVPEHPEALAFSLADSLKMFHFALPESAWNIVKLLVCTVHAA